MEDNFTPELIEKAKQAKSAEDILAIAKENGIALSEDEAKAYFERLNKSGELSDEELDNVSGGCGGGGGGGGASAKPKERPIHDTQREKCEHFVCVMCQKACNATYWINHTCLDNELVPNVCAHCKYRMTSSTYSPGELTQVCWFSS